MSSKDTRVFRRIKLIKLTHWLTLGRLDDKDRGRNDWVSNSCIKRALYEGNLTHRAQTVMNEGFALQELVCVIFNVYSRLRKSRSIIIKCTMWDHLQDT